MGPPVVSRARAAKPSLNGANSETAGRCSPCTVPRYRPPGTGVGSTGREEADAAASRVEDESGRDHRSTE
jgi:hypothetical protein